MIKHLLNIFSPFIRSRPYDCRYHELVQMQISQYHRCRSYLKAVHNFLNQQIPKKLSGRVVQIPSICITMNPKRGVLPLPLNKEIQNQMPGSSNRMHHVFLDCFMLNMGGLSASPSSWRDSHTKPPFMMILAEVVRICPASSRKSKFHGFLCHHIFLGTC